jgi:hypothetical protein
MNSSDADQPGPDTRQELEAELQRIDADLAELRREVHDLRTELVDAGPVDAVDRTSILTQAEEVESFVATLEQRRETVVERLAQAP